VNRRPHCVAGRHRLSGCRTSHGRGCSPASHSMGWRTPAWQQLRIGFFMATPEAAFTCLVAHQRRLVQNCRLSRRAIELAGWGRLRLASAPRPLRRMMPARRSPRNRPSEVPCLRRIMVQQQERCPTDAPTAAGLAKAGPSLLARRAGVLVSSATDYSLRTKCQSMSSAIHSLQSGSTSSGDALSQNMLVPRSRCQSHATFAGIIAEHPGEQNVIHKR
jgi:hypothetical protein